jgi:hypothetical protein
MPLNKQKLCKSAHFARAGALDVAQTLKNFRGFAPLEG